MWICHKKKIWGVKQGITMLNDPMLSDGACLSGGKVVILARLVCINSSMPVYYLILKKNNE